MCRKLTIKDVPVEGKKVFVRVDYNVPLSGENVIDDSKIRATLPTMKYLLERGVRVIAATHLGRPKGRVVEELRLDPVAKRLSELLGVEVIKCNTVAGAEVERAVEALPPGGVLLLENVRFEPGEEKNDPGLAASFAALADLFVNDAFGTSHRAHASNCGITRHLPAVAGLLVEKELHYLNKSREKPQRPLAAILGGKKVADKIGVIEHFLNEADSLMLGGAMANTFLKARGLALGSSLYEEDKLDAAAEILSRSQKRRARLLLPLDVVIVETLRSNSPSKTVNVEDVPEGWIAVDIGPRTVDLYSGVIEEAKTVLWNGPLGAYEFEPFDWGTEMIARTIAGTGAESIIGGGDVVAALEKLGLSGKMTHLSTGGGATLEFWEDGELPGLAVLQEK